MEADRPAVYRPRKPRASPLWHCVSRHLPELRASGRVRRAVSSLGVQPHELPLSPSRLWHLIHDPKSSAA